MGYQVDKVNANRGKTKRFMVFAVAVKARSTK